MRYSHGPGIAWEKVRQGQLYSVANEIVRGVVVVVVVVRRVVVAVEMVRSVMRSDYKFVRTSIIVGGGYTVVWISVVVTETVEVWMVVSVLAGSVVVSKLSTVLIT